MLDAIFRERVPTVGDMLLVAKRRLIEPRPDDELRAAIDQMGRAWRPEAVLAVERREHLSLYNLIGDPSMRLPRPADLSLACADVAAQGTTLAVEGTCAVAGEAVVELVTERTPDVPQRAGDGDADFAKCYERANARVRATAKARSNGRGFKAAIEIPADLRPGSYFVRAFVAGRDGAALGARPVTVVRAKPVGR
jgi:hypothetical protein